MVPRLPSLRILLRLCKLRKIQHDQGAEGQDHSPRIRIEGDNQVSFAVSCRHCTDPLCVKSCIAGALSKKDGVVCIDQNKCVGCHTCVLVCPYGALMPSESGVMQKCELCIENAGGKPACVQGCPNKAIIFEERD